MASLDFIDENRLLFTFRVPGLIHREIKAGESPESEERKIKAVVLTLPAGNVEAEGVWTVHDRTRYLWMLKDGHFLLRDQSNLERGDAHLILKPLLQFPGPLLWLELDPSQRFLVSNSFEPAATPSKAGEVGSPETAAATVTEDNQSSSSGGSADAGNDANAEPPKMVVRILHRETGQVMLVSRVRSTVHLPINSEGYLESLRGRGEEWVLNLNFFTGGSKVLGSVDSTCAPNNEFISQQEVLVTACDGSGGHKLVAFTTDGKTQWVNENPETEIWPLLATSANGLRAGAGDALSDSPGGAYAPLGNDDIKGQLVRVLDAATGEVAFESPASPVLDAGGNAALRPLAGGLPCSMAARSRCLSCPLRRLCRIRGRKSLCRRGCQGALKGIRGGRASGAKQLAEKLQFECRSDEKHTSVAEATAHVIGFIPGIKPRPTTRMSFSASCKGPFHFAAFSEPFDSAQGRL